METERLDRLAVNTARYVGLASILFMAGTATYIKLSALEIPEIIERHQALQTELAKTYTIEEILTNPRLTVDGRLIKKEYDQLSENTKFIVENQDFEQRLSNYRHTAGWFMLGTILAMGTAVTGLVHWAENLERIKRTVFRNKSAQTLPETV
ncbi:MAG: hypothetical protein ABIJ20_01840 [Nanoarchaeota archaeon]|nr:hypothetical protein [Nanoarchaeota archaeon]MBU1444672.1 hypothetical protein [Nanoarchaeota archaeon]MBU2406643.1 hypothetical protein [Nanoarchaeota archaeon]MBU2420310.1 hypothetical protein [Nanoarchaeota archaeon]MBU2475014.1 hypothetical protein [Nanoarchaeota archaeon]